MLARYFEQGGPVMYAVLAVWVFVLAAVLDRLLYAAGRVLRRPGRRVVERIRGSQLAAARGLLEEERLRASRGLARIEALSQVATSLGLFGTVLGIARAFFARGAELGLAAPEVLAGGLATALYTTVAGLVVFLFGQGFLIAWREWESFCEHEVELLLARAEGGGR